MVKIGDFARVLVDSQPFRLKFEKALTKPYSRPSEPFIFQKWHFYYVFSIGPESKRRKTPFLRKFVTFEAFTGFLVKKTNKLLLNTKIQTISEIFTNLEKFAFTLYEYCSFWKQLADTWLTVVNQIVEKIYTKISNWIARSRTEISNINFRNLPSRSVLSYEASKISEFARPTLWYLAQKPCFWLKPHLLRMKY